MIAGILVLLALLHCVDLILKRIGFFKPDWSYSLTTDVLKPLGYTYTYYYVKNDIICILKVRKKLEELRSIYYMGQNWSMILMDLERNKQLEVDFINELKKVTI